MNSRSLLIYAFKFIILIVMVNSCQCGNYYLMPGVAHHVVKAHYDIYVSHDFDSKEIDLIEEAALEWQEKTNQIVSYSIYYNWDNNYTSIKHKYHSIAMIKLSGWDRRTLILDKEYGDETYGRILGLYSNHEPIATIFLVYDRMLGSTYYKSVIIHEIGHSLELEHTKEEDAVMFHTADSATPHITKIDLMQFCKKFGCKIEELTNK